MKTNNHKRKNCPMRHSDNGNCLPVGGFCTAVNNIICDALHSALYRGYVMASERYTEVVRCKDCIHSSQPRSVSRLDLYCNNYDVLSCDKEQKIVSGTHFCSYGEKGKDLNNDNN